MSRVARDRSPYDLITDRLGPRPNGNPIDVAVDGRLRHRTLNRQIARASGALFKALPSAGDRERWFAWEALTGRRALERDRALFDFGYLTGEADGRAAEIENRMPTGRAASLMARIRSTVVAEGLPDAANAQIMLLVGLAFVGLVHS